MGCRLPGRVPAGCLSSGSGNSQRRIVKILFNLLLFCIIVGCRFLFMEDSVSEIESEATIYYTENVLAALLKILCYYFFFQFGPNDL